MSVVAPNTPIPTPYIEGADIHLLPIHTYAGTFDRADVCRRRLLPDISPLRRRTGWSRAHFYRGENVWQMSVVRESDCAIWQDWLAGVKEWAAAWRLGMAGQAAEQWVFIQQDSFSPGGGERDIEH
jgi:hypothetical protein